MTSSGTESPSVRFGPFDADLQTQELRKHGVRLRLPGQSFQVLKMLLERPGDLITREELQHALWPSDTFVDFDHGLSAAVNRLRDALGDSADKPQFIETLPRRGYRFVAAVKTSLGQDTRILDETSELGQRALLKRAGAIVGMVGLALVTVTLWRSLQRLPQVTEVVKLTNDANAKFSRNLPVTDGVHLYFVEGALATGSSSIAQISAAGGETSHVVTPLRQISLIYDIAPNFSELLVGNGVGLPPDPATGRSGGALELWIQPLPAGSPHRVGNFWATGACYTPGGASILYADGRSLITINRDGSNPRELAKLQGAASGLRYSPDGKRIRFSIVGGPWLVSSQWEIDANGSNLHPLLPNWKESPFQCCGNWSRDGNYYFFQAGQGNNQAIWVIPEHRLGLVGARGSPSRLITGPSHLSAPVPSANGKKLFVIGEELRVESVRYDSKTRRFESYLNGASISSFELSPDRKWIAYVTYPEMSLWRSRADGTDKVQLTFPSVRAYGPRWSPDGSKIAFTDMHFDRPWTASLISSSGGTPPQSVPSDPPGEVDGTVLLSASGDPNWLPDGRSIIYGMFSPDGTSAIRRKDLDTGKTSLIPNSEGRYSPRISPDGRYISAFSLPSDELLLFDLKTNRWSSLSLAKGEVFGYNAWSRDGKYVYARNAQAGNIIRVRVDDARIEEVVSLKDLPQLANILTDWFGLTSDDDPVLIRDRSMQEIYSLVLR